MTSRADRASGHEDKEVPTEPAAEMSVRSASPATSPGPQQPAPEARAGPSAPAQDTLLQPEHDALPQNAWAFFYKLTGDRSRTWCMAVLIGAV